jgi:hypothetical protein
MTALEAGASAEQATESVVVAGPNRVLAVRRSAENLPYLVALVVAPLINLAISINSFHHFHTLSQRPLPINHWIFSLSEFVLGGILLLFTINLLRTFLLGHRQIRTTLFAFGILSTLDLLLNLMTITTAIYSFKLGSFYLLLIALGLYCSLNLIFLFWYWFIDYPGQVRQLHHPDHLCQIIFPREAASANGQWLPGCLDYVYFTVMTSNTLGPPENHSPVGRRVKLLQLLHSTLMLVLLVIVISRAVNTLS